MQNNVNLNNMNEIAILGVGGLSWSATALAGIMLLAGVVLGLQLAAKQATLQARRC